MGFNSGFKVLTKSGVSRQIFVKSPLPKFTKIQDPTTCGQMDGQMVGRKDGHDEWRILIRRSGLAEGYKTPSSCPSAWPYLRSVFPADEAQLRTPDGNKKTDRRAALSEKLPSEHGVPLTRNVLWRHSESGRQTDGQIYLLLHTFWGAQWGGYADRHIFGCDAVQCGINLARFRNKFLPPSR